MDDLSAAIFSAWSEHGPRILGDPAELKRRLARRRLKMFGWPPRAWCLAVRANDLRINPATACIVPEHAAYPKSHSHQYQEYAEHEVTLDARLLRTICRPVTLSPWGHTVQDVAKMLGVTEQSLEYTIDQGVFRVEWKRVSWKRKQRILYSEQTFDPSSCSLKRKPDPIWGSMWGHHADVVPDDLEQTVMRVPMTTPTRRGGFRAWHWGCPKCNRRVRIVFYPLPVINLPEFMGFEKQIAPDPADAIRPPPATFACGPCHRVRYFNRVSRGLWNELVSHVTGGLLYGFEVKRPEWLVPARRKNFAPRINQAPSKRRAQVLERLLKGWLYQQIADDLGIAWHTVSNYTRIIYKQHRVHSRKQLIRQHRRRAGAELISRGPGARQTWKRLEPPAPGQDALATGVGGTS